MTERHGPPALDPPILLLVVCRLLVVVTSSGVVVVTVVVNGNSWLRGSVIWMRQVGMGEKERKANVSTAKYSASKALHYICNIFKRRLYMWTGLQKCQNRGESLVLTKTSIFSLVALEECRLA